MTPDEVLQPSFRCPSCGGRSAVRDTRPTSHARTLRRRWCLVCGHRFSTYEITLEHYKMLDKRRVNIRRRVHAYMRALGKMLDDTKPGGAPG